MSCNTKKKGSIGIAFNFSQNGFWVDVNNLVKSNKYEIAVYNCDTFETTCRHYSDAALFSSPTTIHLFLNNSCLTCGYEEAISVQDFFRNGLVLHPISKPGCVLTQQSSTFSIPSDTKDFTSSTIPSTIKNFTSSTLSSTTKDFILSPIPSTTKNYFWSNMPLASKITILSSVTFLLLIAMLLCTCYFFHVKRKQKNMFFSPSNGKLRSSNVQGLVICCPCSEIHRQATKEFLSLINNFTDLHATTYLDLRLCNENTIPMLVQQICSSVSWIVIIESANFYYHSKEQEQHAFHFCNLMAYFSIQLLKHSIKVKSKNLKMIYRISFDLEFKEFELSQVFPEINGHTYCLLKQSTNFGFCLNFDEIERFFCNLTYEQLGTSDNDTRRWMKNNWKDSSEAKNLEKALLNRIDEMWNSSGCYSLDKKYFAAGKSVSNSHSKTIYHFLSNVDIDNQPERFHKEELEKYYQRTGKDIDSIETSRNNFLFENSDLLTDTQSGINQYSYVGTLQSISSDINSDMSLQLQQINFKTDAEIKNNSLKVIQEPFDELDQLSV